MSDHEPSYESLTESMGWPFTGDYFGDYQGDYIAVLRDDGRIGVLVYGYGSCSGCDAIQAEYQYGSNWRDQPAMRQLVEEMRQTIRWFDSAPAAQAWLVMCNDFWVHEAGAKAFVAKQLGLPVE